MKHEKTHDISGTSFQGYITTTRADLTRAFGEPISLGSSEEKVTIEWGLRFENGTIATIYDWKRYETTALQDDEVYEYHIGGYSAESVNLVHETLNTKWNKVIVTVLGGVAEVEKCPDGVEVEIIDYDNIKAKA